jgi:hypothetical protein
MTITTDLIELEDGTTITRDAFESWIDKSDKRDYCDDSCTCGEHDQKTGTMSWEQYYESHYLASDIKEFLTVRDAKTGKLKDMYDLGKGLKKLLKQTV